MHVSFYCLVLWSCEKIILALVLQIYKIVQVLHANTWSENWRTKKTSSGFLLDFVCWNRESCKGATANTIHPNSTFNILSEVLSGFFPDSPRNWPQKYSSERDPENWGLEACKMLCTTPGLDEMLGVKWASSISCDVPGRITNNWNIENVVFCFLKIGGGGQNLVTAGE